MKHTFDIKAFVVEISCLMEMKVELDLCRFSTMWLGTK